MADDSGGQVLRGINWREAFPFTHLFRTFRIAIHPSKLILALVALLLLYVGGRVLDGLWPTEYLVTALPVYAGGYGAPTVNLERELADVPPEERAQAREYF